MATTTSGTDGGAADNDAATGNTAGVPEPTQTTEAVTADDTTKVDDAATSQTTDQPNDAEAVSEETSPPETQAETSDETIEWAKKKGLEIDPDNPNEVKLAQMQREAEKKMHEATKAAKVTVQPPEEVPLTGNDTIDEVVARQNRAEMQLYVRDWFDANPEMKDSRQELMKIAEERPWLQNMDDVRAHFLADPSRADQLKREGGKQALTNLAQKQQAVPPAANATNSGVFESNKITPENVDQLVAKNNDAWYEANREAILKAAYGNARQ